MRILSVLQLSIAVVILTTLAYSSAAREIRNKNLHFRLSVPESTLTLPDTSGAELGETYYDSISDIVFVITSTDTRFRSVKDYLDCSSAQLENELRICYDDSALHLLSCNAPKYYPDRTVFLLVEVSVLPGGFNESAIYFIHHRNKDLQFSFMFRKSGVATGLDYIDKVMKTLKLE